MMPNILQLYSVGGNELNSLEGDQTFGLGLIPSFHPRHTHIIIIVLIKSVYPVPVHITLIFIYRGQ